MPLSWRSGSPYGHRMSTTFRRVVTALQRSARPARLVVEGRVSCPYSRRDIDVDWCYTCPSFRGTFAGGVWLRCAGSPARQR